MIIAGDIGGTKTNVALFGREERGVLELKTLESFPSAGYQSLEDILEEFNAKHRPEITHACFGVAGPVVDGRVDATNLAWEMSARSLAGTLKVETVSMINDLEAMAYGVETLVPAQLHTLSEGDCRRRHGHRGLIAAGTGLGMASIYWDGTDYHPMPSEGGHVDFAPRSELETGLLDWLSHRYGHVSYERILSGPGLFNVYSFLRESGFAEEPAWLAAELETAEDSSAAISKAALGKKSELAVKTLEMFVEIYGAMAGNLALVLKSVGGLYVGGGIAPKILDKLKDGSFMKAFNDKGRMAYLTASIPVHVILDDTTSLYGAATCALKQGKAF